MAVEKDFLHVFKEDRWSKEEQGKMRAQRRPSKAVPGPLPRAHTTTQTDSSWPSVPAATEAPGDMVAAPRRAPSAPVFLLPVSGVHVSDPSYR